MTWATFLFDKEIYKQPENTVVLLNKSWTSLTEEEITLLNKILAAVKVNPEGVIVMKTASLDDINLENQNATKTLAFGLKAPDQQSHGFAEIGQNKIVFSPELSALNDNEKKILWGNLRKVFS